MAFSLDWIINVIFLACVWQLKSNAPSKIISAWNLARVDIAFSELITTFAAAGLDGTEMAYGLVTTTESNMERAVQVGDCKQSFTKVIKFKSETHCEVVLFFNTYMICSVTSRFKERVTKWKKKEENDTISARGMTWSCCPSRLRSEID